MASKLFSSKFVSNVKENSSFVGSVSGQGFARAFYRVEKPFLLDGSKRKISEKLALSHMKTAKAFKNAFKFGKAQGHLSKAMECQPPETCSPETAEKIVMLSKALLELLTEMCLNLGYPVTYYFSYLDKSISVYAKSIAYMPEKGDEIRYYISVKCNAVATRAKAAYPEHAPVLYAKYIGLAYLHNPGPRRQELENLFCDAFLEAMRKTKPTIGYNGKYANLYSPEGLRHRPSPIAQEGFFLPDLVKVFQDSGLPPIRQIELRAEAAQIIAEKALANKFKPSTDFYYPLLEHTLHAISWLPAWNSGVPVEKIKNVHETLAKGYLEFGKNAAGKKEFFQAAFLLRIAELFDSSPKTEQAIDAQLAHLTSTSLLALSKLTVDGFFGKNYAARLAEWLSRPRFYSLDEDNVHPYSLVGVNQIGNVLLGYIEEPKYLMHVFDATGRLPSYPPQI